MTATCPSCNAPIVAGSRWCAICHTNVVAPTVGRLSSPGKRLGAHLLDLLVPFAAFLMIFAVAGGVGAAAGKQGAGVGSLIGVLLLIGYVIWALILFTRGRTPGKALLGMRVVKEDGRVAGFWTMLIREWVGKFISGLIFSLGFLWILFDRDNQGWHDKLMSTYVVE